jgi:hypothetical protein
MISSPGIATSGFGCDFSANLIDVAWGRQR